MDNLEEERLSPPNDFEFPFTPYDIQHNFMKALYTTIENRKMGIFESPTGTVCGISSFHFIEM